MLRGIRKCCSRAPMALAASFAFATPVLAGPSDVEVFVMLHRCEVQTVLTMLYETSGHPIDRYLILGWAPLDRDYVQCEFEPDNSAILCEASSEFYYKDGWRVSDEGKAALARLGFSMDESKGNYAQSLNLERRSNLEKTAQLMLTALYVGYHGQPDLKLDWQASYVPLNSIASKCAPTS
jgi:hypothetical protein